MNFFGINDYDSPKKKIKKKSKLFKSPQEKLIFGNTRK